MYQIDLVFFRANGLQYGRESETLASLELVDDYLADVLDLLQGTERFQATITYGRLRSRFQVIRTAETVSVVSVKNQYLYKLKFELATLRPLVDFQVRARTQYRQILKQHRSRRQFHNFLATYYPQIPLLNQSACFPHYRSRATLESLLFDELAKAAGQKAKQYLHLG